MCGVVHVFFMGKCELGELEALQPGNEKTQKNKNKIYKLTRWTAEARRRTGTVAGRRWVYHSAWRDDDELIIMRGRQQERGNHGPSPARSVRRLHRRIPRRRRPLQAPASSSYVLVVVCIVLTLTHSLTHSHTVLDSLAFALVSHPYGQPLLFLLILLTTIRQSFPMLSSLFFSHNNSTPPLLFHPHPLVRLHLRALGWRPHLLFRCLVRRPFGLHSFSRVSSQSHRLVAQ